MTYEYEEWIDLYPQLHHFPNHQISTCGRVRNKRTGHILKPFSDRYGYLRVSIGNTDNVYIHRLVCEAFFGPAPEGCDQINHIDCNRQNNSVFNLEWCDAKHNIHWGLEHGSIDWKPGIKRAIEVNRTLVRIVETDEIFPSVKDLAEYLNVKPTNVSRVLTGERKGQRLKGYHIEYA